jgi:hypothetical protein
VQSDPNEWLDDYWQRVQYDEDLTENANLELEMLRSPTEEGI